MIKKMYGKRGPFVQTVRTLQAVPKWRDSTVLSIVVTVLVHLHLLCLLIRPYM